LSEEETGEKPVRARRRKARLCFFLPAAAKQGQAIGKNPEKVKKDVPSRNILLTKTSVFNCDVRL